MVESSKPGRPSTPSRRERAAQHFEPVMDGGNWTIRFVWGSGSRYPKQAGKLELSQRFGSQDQVAEVWRVERPTEKTNRFAHFGSIPDSLWQFFISSVLYKWVSTDNACAV